MRKNREIDYSELTFRSAILDSISANIAVLNPTGEILAVNLSWREFAAANQMDDARLGVGANYLEVCRSANLDPNARAALEGILGVMSGQLLSFYHKYPCHSPTEARWFAIRATPLIDHPNFVVVSHENITEHILARIAVRPLRALFLIATIASVLGYPSGWASADSDELTEPEKRTDASNETGTLIVRAQGLKTGDGSLRFVLFDSKENFLKRPTRAEIIDIDDRQGIWTIDDLPFGVYAVLAHHDVNASGTMERHWYGKPKEPTGASNNAPARFGPPKFRDAKFRFESPTLTITVTVK